MTISSEGGKEERRVFLDHDHATPMKNPTDCDAAGFAFDCQPPNEPRSNAAAHSLAARREPGAATSRALNRGHTSTTCLDAVACVPRENGDTRRRTSSGAVVCRICHEDDTVEDLIAPCYCAGTMGLIHRTCMEKWLAASHLTCCELCKCKIQLRTRRRNAYQWFRWTLEEWAIGRDRQHRRSIDDPDSDGRHLAGDGICFLFLTPMAFTSAGLCAQSALAKSGQPWEAAGLTMLTVFLLAIYVIWIAMSLRFHLSQFRNWQQTHLEYFVAATPYPPQGGRVTSRLTDIKVRVHCEESLENEGDIRTIRPLPSFAATPVQESVQGCCPARGHIPLAPLNDSVFVDCEGLSPMDASTPNDPEATMPKKIIEDFVSAGDLTTLDDNNNSVVSLEKPSQPCRDGSQLLTLSTTPPDLQPASVPTRSPTPVVLQQRDVDSHAPDSLAPDSLAHDSSALGPRSLSASPRSISEGRKQEVQVKVASTVDRLNEEVEEEVGLTHNRSMHSKREGSDSADGVQDDGDFCRSSHCQQTMTSEDIRSLHALIRGRRKVGEMASPVEIVGHEGLVSEETADLECSSEGSDHESPRRIRNMSYLQAIQQGTKVAALPSPPPPPPSPPLPPPPPPVPSLSIARSPRDLELGAATPATEKALSSYQDVAHGPTLPMASSCREAEFGTAAPIKERALGCQDARRVAVMAEIRQKAALLRDAKTRRQHDSLMEEMRHAAIRRMRVGPDVDATCHGLDAT